MTNWGPPLRDVAALYGVDSVAASGSDCVGKMDESNEAELTLDEDDVVVGTELSMLLGNVYAGVVPNVPGLPPPDPSALL